VRVLPQRERGATSRAVALLAVLLEERRDVLGERHRCRIRSHGGATTHHREPKHEQEPPEHGASYPTLPPLRDTPQVPSPPGERAGGGAPAALDWYVQRWDLVSTESSILKKLTKTGNSLALVLDKPLLDRAQIDANTPLEVSTDGDVIVITPVRDRRRTSRLKRIVAEAHRQYGGVFKRLADS
jgi:antitoxin MazE